MMTLILIQYFAGRVIACYALNGQFIVLVDFVLQSYSTVTSITNM